MTRLASPTLAIGFGAFFLCAETCLHLGDLIPLESWFALPIHDWAAGLLLMYGGVKSGRHWEGGRLYQIAGWAFNVSLLSGAFLGHLEEWSSGTIHDGFISQPVLLILIAILLAVSIGGLVSTITTPSETRPAGLP